MSTTRGDGPPLQKELILVMAGALALAIFYFLPANRRWFREEIIPMWHDIGRQHNRPDIESRKRLRYGSAYTRSKEIADFFRQKGIRQQVLVLVPGPRYFTSLHFNYESPEPSVFYYYTGLKTVRPADANAADAGWYVHVQNGRLIIDSVTDRVAFADSIRAFKKTDASL